MITEDYVSFETAKLLRDKGFPQDPNICNTAYTTKGKFSNNAKSFAFNYELIKPRVYYTAPTQAMAMKWLRERGIYVYVEPFITISSEGYNLEGYRPWTTTFKRNRFNRFNPLNEIGEVAYTQSYEEAIEAALKYSLENLI